MLRATDRVLTLGSPAFLLAAALSAQLTDASFPAHRVIGNVYYVGSRELASYLITTPQGHILINSGMETSVPQIQASVASLGFRFADIKILLDSHAHLDHVAGNLRVRQLTGAKVMVMRGDQGIVSSGGKGDFQYSMRWPACPVDRVLSDGDVVTLGDVRLVAHLTPGHTRGCTTWTLVVNDNGKPLNVVIVGSPNVNPGYRLVGNTVYPQIADDFARTFRVLRALPCDVFLGAHGSYYGMPEKYERIGKGSANPFLDPAGYQAYVAGTEKAFREKLSKQEAEAKAKKG